MTTAGRFIDEIRTMPNFAAAAGRDPQWLDQLDDLTDALQAIYASDIDCVVAASDRITTIIRGTAPLKARLLAVNDELAALLREVN